VLAVLYNGAATPLLWMNLERNGASVKTEAKILKSPDEFSPHQRGKLDRFSLRFPFTQSLLATL
jgi:hypothetical protein